MSGTPTGAAQTSTPSAHSAASRHHLAPGSGLVIGLLLVSAFVVILNETTMIVALPRLMTDLGVTASTGQWLTTGFLLTMAIVIPITGYLLQRFPLRGVFITAMSLFSAGTLVAATAPGFAFVLAGRVLQAVGTAIMLPLLMTTVLNLVPPSLRGRMMGRISIVIGVAPALGPAISGFIINALDWHYVFWFVLPIALASLALGIAWLKDVTTPSDTPIDVPSVILSALGFGGLVYGLSSIGEGHEGRAVLPAWVPIVTGLVVLAVFVARQLRLQRRDAALLDLRSFQSRTFTVAIAMLAVSMMALFGTLIVLPLFLQNVLRLDALTTGLLLLPGGLTMALLSPVVGHLFDRYGPRPLLVPGAVLVSASLWLFTLTLSTDTAIGAIIAMHTLLHIGLALTLTPLMTSALGSLNPHLYSYGSATIGTVQQLAGATGTAVFVTLLAAGTAAGAEAGVAPQVAYTDGAQTAFLFGAVMSLLSVVAAFFIHRPPTAPENLLPLPH